jgi:hypothetical protein
LVPKTPEQVVSPMPTWCSLIRPYVASRYCTMVCVHFALTNDSFHFALDEHRCGEFLNQGTGGKHCVS